MQIDLTGQVALVTGSAHRVGKAIALELARHGVHILIHYNRSPETTAQATVEEIQALGVQAVALQADLSQPHGVERVFAALQSHFGGLNILVNSASNFQKRSLMDITLDDWEQTMRINVTAPLLCIQAAVHMMRQNMPPGGCIINICDKGAIRPWPEYAHHGISKAALYALSQVSAFTLGPENIRVNALIPGLVMRPDSLPMANWDSKAERVPLKRVGSEEDVARAVAYLCREDWLSGVTLHVDGGEFLT